MRFWKIFFYLNALLFVFSLIGTGSYLILKDELVSDVQIFDTYTVVSSLLNLFSLFALYGLAYNKKILNKYVWLVMLIALFLIDIIYANYMFFSDLVKEPEIIQEAGLAFMVSTYLVGLVWVLTIIYGVYKYYRIMVNDHITKVST